MSFGQRFIDAFAVRGPFYAGQSQDTALLCRLVGSDQAQTLRKNQ